ncbi:MAG: aminopeptidase P family N-terminal domain-containing protein, partial [Candidatus Dormibacteraeota bacterium]|nr:aminopeptidase P family N-terminal domain-containing protein [Candidatus Dormibacteraeota bacterium]
MLRDAARIDSIQQALREDGLDTLVCSLPANVLLLTGYWPVAGNSLAIVAPGPRTVLIVPEDEGDLARHGWADEVRTFQPGSLEDLRTPEEAIRCPLGEVSGSLGIGCQRVGFESGGMVEPASYAAMHLFGATILILLGEAFPSARLIPASETLSRLRSVKTQVEIDRIREACRIAAVAFQQGASLLGAGLAEIQAAEQFQRGLGDIGSLALPGRSGGFAWCMSGPNAAKACAAYARSGQRVLARGDL